MAHRKAFTTKQTSADIYIHNPKSRQRAQKFKQRFGVNYMEGVKTDYTLAIAPIDKLAKHNIPHPYGVLATTNIPAGATLAEYTGDRLENEPDDVSYVYRAGKTFIDGRTSGSIGRFFNHSDNNNCRFVTQGGHVLVKTLRDIYPGEQLTVSYGHKYFTADIDRIYIDAHHTFESDQEVFEKRQADYTRLSQCRNADFRKTVQQLVNCTNKDSIRIPGIKQPNYPILVMDGDQVSDDQAEVTLFHALCHTLNSEREIAAALSIGASLGIQCSNGRNALYYTVTNDRLHDDVKAKRLAYLFEHSQSYEEAPYVTDREFSTLYHYCLKNQLNGCLGTILKYVTFHIDHFDAVVESPFVTAIAHGNIDGLNMLLARISRVDIWKHLESEQTYLHLAKTIAKIHAEKTRHMIYSGLSSFMNVAQLVMTVDAHTVKPKKTHSHVSSTTNNSVSLSHSLFAQAATVKREKKPNPRYLNDSFVSNVNSASRQNTTRKRQRAESSGNNSAKESNTHTLFSSKKQRVVEPTVTTNVNNPDLAVEKKRTILRARRHG